MSIKNIREITMPLRKIIKIDEDKCNGCGKCIPNCPEGALQIIDGKARLLSDFLCDGLGACVGHCPFGAITIEEREAKPYNERKVMENIVKQGPNTISAHLQHLKDHGADEYLQEALKYLEEHGISLNHESESHSICSDSMTTELPDRSIKEEKPLKSASHLKNWPVQIMLVPTNASYLKGAELIIAADCVPFAYPDFHEDFLKDRVLLVGCPKLDDCEYYKKKLATIFKENEISTLTCVHMEVPCCFGLVNIVKSALESSGKVIPFKEAIVSIRGEKKN